MPFPVNPTNGQQYNDGTYTYQYNAVLRTWTKIRQTLSNVGNVVTSNNSVTTGNTTISSNTVSVGNTIVSTSNVSVGNTVVSSSNVSVGDTVVSNAGVSGGNLTSNSLTVGDTVINNSNVTVGNTVIANNSITLGNSNVTSNSITVGNAVINTSNITIGNAVVSTNSITLGNANITSNTVTMGNSVINTSNITIGNAIVSTNSITLGNANITSNSIAIGNTSISNSNITLGNSTITQNTISAPVLTGNLESGNTSIKPVANGNIAISIAGTSNVLVISDTGTTVTGNTNISGTATIQNIKVNDLYSNRAPVQVDTNTVIDSFSLSQYRSAKYTIKANNDLGYQALEVLLIHNNINSIITVYGSLSTSGSDIVLISTIVSNGNVMLLATGLGANTAINLMGTYVPD